MKTTGIGKMNYAVIDVETSIGNNGHPFTKTNKLCAVGIKDKDGLTVYDIEHGDEPYGAKLAEIRERIERAAFLVVFNIMFDLHWIRRYIPDIVFPDVFDDQLAEFILTGQSNPYPSLGDTVAKYGIPAKLDRVSAEYWELGIDTPQVPWELLSEYCAHDVEITEQLYLEQKKKLDGNMKRLFWLQCQDLLLLEEIEWNGLLYDFETARTAGQELQAEGAKIDEELHNLVDALCVDFGSSDHLSVILYGGVIYEKYRETYTKTLKSGEIKEKERWSIRPVEFRRMVKPLPGTETKPTSGLSDDELTEINRTRISEGRVPYVRHWSVAEPILGRLVLRGKADILVRLILRKSRIRKLASTYYTGLVNKAQQMGWDDGIIHGQFNQLVARTGRLSSSEPNEQNFDNDIKRLFPTRYQTV